MRRAEATHRSRCHCARTTIFARAPRVVTYCHCADCRRLSGAPVTAFAGFAEGDIRLLPDEGQRARGGTAQRTFCPDCGTPLTGRYSYLPGQVFVGVGLFDDPGALPPTGHAHAGHCLSWLRIDDDLPRAQGSDRERLDAADRNAQKAADDGRG